MSLNKHRQVEKLLSQPETLETIKIELPAELIKFLDSTGFDRSWYLERLVAKERQFQHRFKKKLKKSKKSAKPGLTNLEFSPENA